MSLRVHIALGVTDLRKGRDGLTMLVQEVLVLEGGYSWQARTYASLSEVARAISGTRWSGPRFFGLKA